MRRTESRGGRWEGTSEERDDVRNRMKVIVPLQIEEDSRRELAIQNNTLGCLHAHPEWQRLERFPREQRCGIGSAKETAPDEAHVLCHLAHAHEGKQEG